MSSSTTHVQCGSGLSPKCTHPGIYSSNTPGIILCSSCAQLNPYASALRKIDLQRTNQFNAAAGGVAGLQFGAPTVTGTAEDYSEEGGVVPVIHSLLNARTVLQIPALLAMVTTSSSQRPPASPASLAFLATSRTRSAISTMRCKKNLFLRFVYHLYAEIITAF
jgi:hypothetical protein